MAGRWGDPSAFRADPDAAPAAHPSRRQTIALLAVLALVAGTVALVSYLIRPEKARAFDLFHGSLFLSDQFGPVAVDLTSGKPSLQLLGADKQVGVGAAGTLGVVPLEDHTLLLNQTSGEFNMVDNGGFVVKHDGGGVPLVKRAGPTSAVGIASTSGQAYIVRTGATGGTDVYLVSQSTVEEALNASSKVRPRASGFIAEPSSTEPGGAASAEGNLWLLVGGTGTSGLRTIRELSVPAGSSAGATLVPSDQGQVSGPAAIGTATTGADGSGPTVVGVASASRIDLFVPGSDGQPITHDVPPDVDRILPTSNSAGRLAFLLHGSDGWSLVSVAADGSDLRGPRRLGKIPAHADLAAPAASNGRLYTLDKSTGALYEISYDGAAQRLAGRPTYPYAKGVEAPAFGDAYVLARGPRVVFDSASHADALMVFTDGTRDPRIVDKGSAVPVSAAGGSEALTRSLAPRGQPSTKPPKGGQKPPAQNLSPVNNKIDCKTTAQKPHIPVVNPPTPGSRSVALTWTYPVISVQDCVPSTYVVSVTLVSNNAPRPPSSVTVQGQTGVNLTGLFPSTQYDITVTAYIHGEHTTSQPVRITTGPEGPAAPTALQVSADASGNWNLRWDSCGTVAQGCVTAQSWTVTPSFCDNLGVSSPPPPITMTGDPTSKHQPPALYRGNDNLLGRGLRFQVQGVGQNGEVGTPSASSDCVYSWSPPLASAMTLSASQPQNTSLGGSSATNVTLDLGADPIRDVGGVGSTVTFTLTGPGGSRTKGPIVYRGNGSTIAANFTGITPGATYSASATVRTAHGAGQVTLPSVPVVARANWPAMSLTASCPPNGVLHLGCDLTVNINGLSSAQAKGELFDTTATDQAQTQIRCGNQAQPLSRSGFDPATQALTLSGLSLIFNNGPCTVTVVLKESPGDAQPLVFGGSLSPVLSTDITLGSPQTLDATNSDFGATWDTDNGRSAVKLQYNGSFTDDQVSQITNSWDDEVFAPDGTSCGSSNQQPTQRGIDVDVTADCVNRFGSQGGWTVSVSYNDVGTGKPHTLQPSNPSLTGTPPTYQPCTPDPFNGAWDATATSVTVDYTGTDTSKIAGCSRWSFTLRDPGGNDCGTPDNTQDPPASNVIAPSGCQTAPSAGWTVHITWRDTAGDPQSVDVVVSYTPPPT